MSELSNIGNIKNILSRHGFNFSKALGQNFLINPSVCPRMANECGATKQTGVIEVGPGIGVLTYELAKCAKKVVSIELDKRLIPVLNETLKEFDNVKIINADVLKTDLKNLINTEFKNMPVSVCSNLPYYITSPIIMKLLEEKLPITSLTVMVQKEAAERICAKPGTRQCGAVSIAVSYYSEPEILFNVSRGSFMPPPNVDSAVIKLNIRKEPLVNVIDEKFFFSIVKAAFSKRRKNIVNSLYSGLSISKESVITALNQCNIDVNSRAEQLSIEQFANISNSLIQILK